MKQEQFMVDFFPKGTTVSVDANELQELIKAKRQLEDNNKALIKTIDTLEFKVSYLKQVIDLDKLNKPLTVKLDIKG